VPGGLDRSSVKILSQGSLHHGSYINPLVIFVLTTWGLDAFCAKLATNHIGSQSALWYALALLRP